MMVVHRMPRLTAKNRISALFALTALHAWGDCLTIPVGAITPFQTSSGPTFTLSKTLLPTDQLSLTASGSVCLQSGGFYCTNAAGVLVVQGSDGTPVGSSSLNTVSAGFYKGTFSFGSLVIGNPTIGFAQLFSTNAAN